MSTNYYATEKYMQDIISRVGLDDEAVKMNARFASDIYQECEKEYQKSKDLSAFAPLDHMPKCFIDMVLKSLSSYHKNRVGVQS